jgi:hypothetical protein
MSTSPGLIKKFKQLIIDNNKAQGRWMPDEELIRYLRDVGLPHFITTGDLNRMVGRVYLMADEKHDLHDDDGQLLLTLYQIRKQIELLEKKTNKHFYYIKMASSSPPPLNNLNRFYTDIYERHLQYKDGDEMLAFPRRPLVFNKRNKRSSNVNDAGSKKPKSLSHSEIFDIDKEKIFACWNTVHPELPFPSSIAITMKTPTATMATATTATATTTATVASTTTNEYNTDTHAVYEKQNSIVMTNRVFTKYKNALEFVDSLKTVMKKVNCDLSIHSKLLLSGFAASHPQISSENIALIGSISRFIILNDANNNLKVKYNWISGENAAACSPSSSSIEVWVKELAVTQVIIARHQLQGLNVYLQTDGGHLGQEVRLLSYWDERRSEVRTIWLGLSYCGKTSDDVARGIKLSLDLFRRNNSTIDGATVDSGQGTPESFRAACSKLNICSIDCAFDSCGIHDIQSVFRLPMLYCVGEGGLNNNNAVQFLHTLFSLFDESRSYWKDIVQSLFEEVYDEEIIPKELLLAMQE